MYMGLNSGSAKPSCRFFQRKGLVSAYVGGIQNVKFLKYLARSATTNPRIEISME